MFVGLRDLKFARGRFSLIGAVVALITILVGFLSGLTGGLAIQNISAVLELPGDRIVFSAPSVGEDASFADSAITTEQADAWAQIAGVHTVQPIGVSQTRMEADGKRIAVAIFGVEPGFKESSGDSGAPTTDGTVSLSETIAADLEVQVGDEVTVAGTHYTVDAITKEAWYSHTPVAQMTLANWQTYSANTGNPDAHATVLAVSGDADWEAADAAQGTNSETIIGSLMALSAFRSEVGSLLLMVGMLFGISGLVIGAFFTVWTIQRKSDIAVLKALGASTQALRRDALSQAAMILLAGIGVGLAVVVGLGILAGNALPFLLSPLTTVVPSVIMIVLGLAGAGFALRSVTTVDPLTALGSNR